MAVRLARIDVFPIKSFDPVTVETVRVLPSGCLEHDRRYAVFDETGKVVNGKRTPLVHQLHMAFSDDCATVTVTDRLKSRQEAYSLHSERSKLEARLAEHFGFAVTIRENRSAGFPDDTASSGPTVLAVESLETVAAWFDLPFDETRRRFRANLLLEGGGAFWDDRLFGPPGEAVTFRIGDLLLFGTNPCARCVVPSRDSVNGRQQPGFARTFAARRQEALPAWSPPDAFDHFYRLAVNTRLFAPAGGGLLRVGDPVEVLPG